MTIISIVAVITSIITLISLTYYEANPHGTYNLFWDFGRHYYNIFYKPIEF